jgi:uncharacterized protein (DUF58 family)
MGGYTDWQTTGRKFRGIKPNRWRAILWALVYPKRGDRLMLTVPGSVVVAVALSIGVAAYNTSNNILFISLSLLLACLVFSGILSWLNLRNLTWRLSVQAPLRAGKDHPAAIELHNGKRLLPCYGVWFDVATQGEKKHLRLALRERLDPQVTTALEWTLRPETRGPLRVEVNRAVSLFPFGFLKKILSSQLRREVLVWPAPVAYQRFPATAWSQPGQVERSLRAGMGGDLLALRGYVHGDSQRQIHWKASARLGRLMVRQYAAETQTGYVLWVRTAAEDWPRPDQFELMCSLAATLAEDFFRAGRLVAVVIDGEQPVPIRRRHDLDRFLDRLALVEPSATALSHHPASTSSRHTNLMTLAPDGSRGVAAYLDGTKAATA